MSQPSPPTSSSIIGSNDDILTQLLIFLPHKSLRRFRCVSKQWCSLISGTYFIQKRLSRKYRHRSINGLFLHRRHDPRDRENTWKFDFLSMDPNVSGSVVSSTTLSFINDIGGIHIEQSCNGLLLCSTFHLYNFGFRIGQSVRIYYIYNPTTEKYTTLPWFDDGKYSYGPYFSVSLAFNPIKSPHYKVICMLKKDHYDYEIRIYSSETRSWKVITPSHYYYYFPNICGCGVFWNGYLFWHNVGKSVVYFNVEREMLGEEPMPGYFVTSLYFGECKGRLYYVELSESEHWIRIHERISTGWRIKYDINSQRLRDICSNKVGYYSYHMDVKVLLIDGEEKEEEYESPKLVVLIRDKVFSCELRDLASSIEFFDREPEVLFVEGDSPFIHAFQYIKSFASV